MLTVLSGKMDIELWTETANMRNAKSHCCMERSTGGGRFKEAKIYLDILEI